MDKWKFVHDAMLVDLARCWGLPAEENKQVEQAFNIALDYMEDVKKDISENGFENKADEIFFYKNIKPSFTGYIEYYTILYLELNFLPEANSDKYLFFWTEEVKKLQKFLDKHAQFVEYYRNGETHLDEAYFTTVLREDLSGPVKIYDIGSKLVSQMDAVVGALLAQEMYHEYALQKLEQVRKTMD